MPSIIPPIQPPAGSPNVTTTIELAATDYIVAAGETKYSDGLAWLLKDYGFSFPYSTLVNNGTLWASGANAQLLNAYNFGTIFNTGTAVASASNGVAQTYYIGSSSRGMTNSGSIYALAQGGSATAWSDWAGSGVNTNVVNSGIIAAQSTHSATAVFRANGGTVINAVGGSILAEGKNATAIYLGGGHQTPPGFLEQADVVNAGLIEAASTDPRSASVAIYATHGQYARMDIVNTGTIRGDYAIYTDSFRFSPPQHAAATITNEAPGIIDGDIFLDLGNDLVTNRGMIRGYVDMGDDDDVFDNSAGTLIGVADMGWGQDLFIGGEGQDIVTGERGDDVLNGGGDRDLLVGGRGDDVLVGGTGNDGLYGDYGDDRIVMQGGDRAVGGEGNDRIELGDYSFTAVEGGAGGQDVLVLAAGARFLDLEQMLSSGRVTGFEELQLGGGKELIVRAGDVATLSGGTSLRIGGSGSDKIDLVGSWVQGGFQTIGGASYRLYSQGVTQVLVQSDVIVTVMADAPGGATGLDAIAVGGAPPVPGGSTGVILSPSLTEASMFMLTGDLTIDADEHWFSDKGISMIIDDSSTPYEFVNYGRLTNDGTTGGARVVAGVEIENRGRVEATVVSGTDMVTENRNHLATYGINNSVSNMPGNATAISGSGVNYGLVSAVADQWIAVGYVGGAFRNEGTITATSTLLAAAGIYSPFDIGRIINTGDINVTGAVAAYGVGFGTHASLFENSGTILAQTTVAGGTAFGVYYYYQTGINRLFNSGTITAATAIQTSWNINGGALVLGNTGQITGLIELNVNPNGGSAADDIIINRGAITGNVLLGGGRDVYVGDGGTQIGAVYGQAGDDVMIGTSHGETLDGGEGNDVLLGGGGNTLRGGAGRDRFVYTGTGTETIGDFTGGSDRIDLSALAPSNVTISGSGAATTVTAVTSGGTLVIHVNGSVAQSDIVTTAPSNTGTANDDLLIAAMSGATLLGMGGSDMLIGRDGNDTLDGGTGPDVMIGGAGDDIYYFNESGDSAREAQGGGYDTIQNSAGWIEMPENIEKMAGGGGRGNALDNVMIGSDGNDEIDGAGGNDVMAGGKGDDTYYADSQADLVFENAGEGRDTITASSSFYLYQNIENLVLYWDAGAAFGVGNGLNNLIDGNIEANLLLGGGGDDTINGYGGDDSLFGESGNDRVIGNEGTDYIAGGEGNDDLSGDGGADAVYGEGGDDILWGGQTFHTDILVGGEGNDILHGESDWGDYDLMDGGAGNDTYYVDTPADLTFEAAGGGTDTVYATINGAGYYLYANVENLVLGGNTPFGVGNELANRLTGSAASNWLLGGAGDDVLNGKAGNDILFGETGADTFVFELGTGGDVIGDFVAGTDRIDLSAFGITSFQAVLNSMHENGGNTAIDLGNGSFVVINGVAASAFSAGDFILSGAASPKSGLPVVLPDLPEIAAVEPTGPADAVHIHMWHSASDWVPLLL